VQALLAKNTAVARQGLRKVLVEGRLACTPITEGNRRGYGFTGRGSFGPLIAGEAVTSDSNGGGLGGHFGAPGLGVTQRSAPGFPGGSERRGVWGAISGPPTFNSQPRWISRGSRVSTSDAPPSA